MANPELDDLDQAQCLLDKLYDVATDEQGIVCALAASAHIAMWHAKQQRDMIRRHAEAQRAAEEWRANQPPPPMPWPGSYQGF